MKGEIRSTLTGLRGLAALLVVITHYWLWTRVTPIDTLPAWIGPWTQTSGIGMSIFFTLSGYVIALSYSDWDWRGRPGFNLIRLFSYRFARLYPAYFIFVIMIVLRWPELRDLSDAQAQSYLIPHLLLMQAWLPVKYGGDLAATGHFHVSWSLSVECALYLAFGVGAILVAAFPKWPYKSLVLGAAFFASASALVHVAWLERALLMPSGWNDTDWVLWLYFFSPYAVSLQFGIGVAAYRNFPPVASQPIGAARQQSRRRRLDRDLYSFRDGHACRQVQ